MAQAAATRAELSGSMPSSLSAVCRKSSGWRACPLSLHPSRVLRQRDRDARHAALDAFADDLRVGVSVV